MNRSKFKYDHENLRYLELNKNFRSKLFKAFTWIMGSLILAILLNVLYASFFDTPVERQVKQENTALLDYYNDLTQQFVKIDTVLKDVRAIDENLYRTIFETEPVFQKGINENENFDTYFKLINLQNKDLVSSTNLSLADLLEEVNVKAPEYKHLMNFSGQNKEMLMNLPAIQPIRNRDLTRMAAGYGVKVHPNYKIKKFHNGMDFIAPTGTEVYATGSGVIDSLVRTKRGNGNTVVIDHGFGYKSVYSYLDNFNNLRFLKKVKRGDVIGWVGNTELSIAPHLHYEVHLNDKAVNPVNYFFLELSPEEYDRLILLSAKSGQSFD